MSVVTSSQGEEPKPYAAPQGDRPPRKDGPPQEPDRPWPPSAADAAWWHGQPGGVEPSPGPDATDDAAQVLDGELMDATPLMAEPLPADGELLDDAPLVVDGELLDAPPMPDDDAALMPDDDAALMADVEVLDDAALMAETTGDVDEAFDEAVALLDELAPLVPRQADGGTDDGNGRAKRKAERSASGRVITKRAARTEVRRAEAWPTQRMRLGHTTLASGPPPRARRRPLRHPRRPVYGLIALLLLSLIAIFFAWTSAEPLWLSVGHATSGTATITRCAGSGIGEHCTAKFVATDGKFSAGRVALVGLGTSHHSAGGKLPAQMVSRTGRVAYVGAHSGLIIRWLVGLGLVLLCGFAIAWASGAYRLPGRRARTIAILLSVGGPLTLTIGVLAATF